MIEPQSLADLVKNNPLADCQQAIVKTLSELLPGLEVKAHPGRVDISKTAAKTIVKAPGIGIGFSRILNAKIIDGSFSAMIEWVAYIVVEAKVIDKRRVEKEAIGLAIGHQILKILSDKAIPLWNLNGILPPDQTKPIECRPLFTLADANKGAAFYTVSWQQTIADIGQSYFDKTQNDDVKLIRSFVSNPGAYDEN